MSPFVNAKFPLRLFGGDERDRTDDPLLAKQVLSQLSYTPIFGARLSPCTFWVWVALRIPKIKQRIRFLYP